MTIRRRLDLTGDPFRAMRLILSRPTSCILDVGAHEGQTALRFARVFPEAQITSFEPDPENFEALVRNTRGVGSIVPVRMAVAGVSGPTTLYRTRFNQTHSLLKPRGDAAPFLTAPDLLESVAPVRVDAVTLDDFCAERGLRVVDVLKVDAQGAELSILQGAIGLLRSRTRPVVFLEVNFVHYYEQMALFPAVYQFLYELGYRLVALYDLGFTTHYYQVGCNALFVEEEAGRRRDR